MVMGPNWVLFVIACVLLVLSGIVGKVMQAMGLGAEK
jgi:hypothetical protein